MFFQVFKDDILEFPSSLIANVNDIPGIVCDCKSGNTVRTTNTDWNINVLVGLLVYL
jgi:hypothetical protein